MKRILFVTLSLFLFLFPLGPVKAQTVPDFPQCVNPQGTLKVEYSSGTHGIVGDPGQFLGSDRVYQVTTETLIQCFCAEDGSAIQTNWWRVSGLSEEEIENVENQGWVFIPDGSLWGLDQASYLAKNSSYRCKEDGVGGVRPTSSQAPVLSLADTGGIRLPMLLAALGLLSFANGVRLLSKSK